MTDFRTRRAAASPRYMLAVTLGALALMVLIIWASSGEAAAQAAVDASNAVVDLWPYIEPVLEIVFVVALGVAGLLARRLLAWLGVNLDDKRRALIDDGLYKALSFGRAQIVVGLKDMSEVEIRNATLRHGIRFMLDTYAKSLKTFDITPEGVSDRLLLRYGDVFPEPKPEPIDPRREPESDRAPAAGA